MTFAPKFAITHRLFNLLTQIVLLREKILSLPILPQREIRLMRSARWRMVHSSTAIEGNPLSLHDVKEVLEGKIVTGISEKDRLEVINYEKVVNYIESLFKQGQEKITEKIVLQVHRLTTKGILKDKESGYYRKGPVWVVLRPSNKIVYQAPKGKLVSSLMKDLIDWLGRKETEELSPVIVAGIVHHQMVTIHPFTDGNGRVARALATLVLYIKGYDIKRIFSLEDYYNLDRGTYYHAIAKSRKEKNLTFWLEYFSQGLLAELQQVYQKVEHFSLERKVGKAEPIYLSSRQRGILDLVAINGKIFRSDVVEAFSVSPRTAHRDLDSLVKLGFLKPKGKGPKTHYVLKNK